MIQWHGLTAYALIIVIAYKAGLQRARNARFIPSKAGKESGVKSLFRVSYTCPLLLFLLSLGFLSLCSLYKYSCPPLFFFLLLCTIPLLSSLVIAHNGRQELLDQHLAYASQPCSSPDLLLSYIFQP